MATSVRDRDGGAARVVSASTAKRSFGAVLDDALAHGVIAITRHDKVRAVLMSVEEYESYSGSHGEASLESLRAEFEVQLARMQRPAAHAATRGLFAAGGAALGRAAARHARRRG